VLFKQPSADFRLLCNVFHRLCTVESQRDESGSLNLGAVGFRVYGIEEGFFQHLRYVRWRILGDSDSSINARSEFKSFFSKCGDVRQQKGNGCCRAEAWEYADKAKQEVRRCEYDLGSQGNVAEQFYALPRILETPHRHLSMRGSVKR
jgi:hypothetical protein